MNAYIYQADIYCDECGDKIRAAIDSKRKLENKPAINIENESSFDSDDYPKGPYANGGGEADSPQHCARCKCFLGNSLTPDGTQYVLESGNAEWMEYYSIS